MKASTIISGASAVLLLCTVIAASAQDGPSALNPKGCAPHDMQTDGKASEGASGSSWRDANAAIPSGGGRSFSGVASFYGNESGSKTASGQRFNQNAMTAAHRSLPFGTKLRVTHNGRSVIVTINDRGPFIKGRVLDLSTGAARAVGLTSSGVGRVTAEVIS